MICNEIAEITARSTAEYETGEGRESLNSIQLKSYLKVSPGLYMHSCEHPHQCTDTCGWLGMSRHGVVQTSEEE